MTISMPAAGRGPGYLLVGAKQEDILPLAAEGYVACVIGEGDWTSALATMWENPCVEGTITISQGGRVWVEERPREAEPVAEVASSEVD